MPKVVDRSIEMQKVGFFSLGDLFTGIKMRLGLGENSLNNFGNMSHPTQHVPKDRSISIEGGIIVSTNESHKYI